MLSAVVTTATTSAAASTTAITMTSVVSIGIGGALIALLLIGILTSRELLTYSSSRSKKVIKSLDSMIIPLFSTFIFAVVFQVIVR
jgi:hypothetical protein